MYQLVSDSIQDAHLVFAFPDFARHEGLEWAIAKTKLEAKTENCGRSIKWKEPAVNQVWLVMITGQGNTFFMIVQQKVRKAAEVFVTTAKGWSQGKNIYREITLLIWQLPWALRF